MLIVGYARPIANFPGDRYGLPFHTVTFESVQMRDGMSLQR